MQCVTTVRKNNQTLDNAKPSVSKGEQKEASLWRAEPWESKGRQELQEQFMHFKGKQVQEETKGKKKEASQGRCGGWVPFVM